MELEYSLSIDDFVGFNERFVKTSRAHRGALAQRRWVLVFVFLIILGAIYLISRSVIMLTIPAIAAFLCILFLPRSYMKGIGKSVRRTYEAAGDPLSGKRKLTLSEGELREDSRICQTTYPLESIVEVVRTERHYFILTSPMSGIIVPIDKIESGDLASFVDRLERYREQAVSASACG